MPVTPELAITPHQPTFVSSSYFDPAPFLLSDDDFRISPNITPPPFFYYISDPRDKNPSLSERINQPTSLFQRLATRVESRRQYSHTDPTSTESTLKLFHVSAVQSLKQPKNKLLP